MDAEKPEAGALTWSRVSWLVLLSVPITLIGSLILQIGGFGLGQNRLTGYKFGQYEFFLAKVALQLAQAIVVASIVLLIARPRNLREVGYTTVAIVLVRWRYIFWVTTYYAPIRGFVDGMMRSADYIGAILGVILASLCYQQIHSRLTRRSLHRDPQ